MPRHDQLESLERQLKDVLKQVQGLIAQARQEEGLPPVPDEVPGPRLARLR